jgi:hypothetical protein
MIRVALTTTATTTSVTSIPANAIIYDCKLDVTTGYSVGTTISIGITGSLSLFMGTADNSPTVIGLYQDMQDTSIGSSAAQVVGTIGGTPSVGAAEMIVLWSSPTN